MSRDHGAYAIVPFDEQYRPDVLRLRAEFICLGPRLNAAHFRWQQEENPHFDGHKIWLILHEGVPVGMRILQAAQWEVGTPPQRFLAPVFVGSYLEPEHRRRRLYDRVTEVMESELAASGVEWAFNLSPVVGTLVTSIAGGWRSIGSLEGARRTPSISGNGIHRRMQRNLVRVIRRFGSPRDGVEVSDEPRAREMALLSQRQFESSGEVRIRRVHDEVFFDWRFRDPTSRYRFVYIERDGELAGFIVLQRPTRGAGNRTFNLVDAVIGENLSWRELLGAVVEYADGVQEDLVTWSHAFPESARTPLSELGFRPYTDPGPLAKMRPTVLVRRLQAGGGHSPWTIEGNPVDDVTGWNLRMLDSDQF